jgi:hypothetical protein
MIRILKRLLETPGRTPPPPPRAVERFGEIELPRALGRTLLRATPKCRVYAERMRDRLEHLTRDEMPDLVDRVLGRLALYVLDLPASERDHHARPFGLLEHSLEVAYGTLAALAGSSFRVSPDPLVDHRERPRWIYAAFVGGLAHDLGKTLGIEVRLAGESRPWDPLREPLAAYALRGGKAETGPETWAFRRGRGLEGDADRTGELLGWILTPEAERYLGDRRAVLEKLFPSRTAAELSRLPEPARTIKAAWGAVDRETSRADLLGSERQEPTDVPPAPPSSGQELESEPPADPPPAAPQGDPVEEARKADHRLDPANLVGALHRFILSSGLDRNGRYSSVYLTGEHVWLTIDLGFERLAKLLGIAFTRRNFERMIESFGRSPLVERWKDGVLVRAVRAGAHRPERGALAVKTLGFLSATDLAKLGTFGEAIVHEGPWRGPASEPARRAAS